MKIFLGYATSEGQTARIAARLSARLQAAGVDVTLADVGTLPRDLDLGAFDAIALGGSVHVGGYQRRLTRFVRRHLATLRSRPSAFFSVCLSIASQHAVERAEAREIPRRWLLRLGWAPSRIAVLAGAAPFTRYGFVTRFVMKRICEREMGPVDVHRDYELTDWRQVDDLADAIGALGRVHADAGSLSIAAEAAPAPAA